MNVRFAPSPTGFLHLGGLRTALFNYLLARQSRGRFVLRIEDTDQTRLVPGAVEQITDALRWAGIPFDEGPDINGSYGPYVQSQRLDLYRDHAHRLLKTNHAYPCFCSQHELEHGRTVAQSANQAHHTYDRRCLGLPKAEVAARLSDRVPHTIRLLVPHGTTVVNDLVYGRIEFNNRIVDDQVLLKSDGFPTYHLANVVDDHQMDITHVVRGEEWLSSTPKHVILYNAFGWTPPAFAHLPLLLDAQKGKLSKRNGDANVNAYMRDYLPEALVNFVAFLGWSPETPREVFTLDELVQEFSLKRVHKAGAVVLRHKLDWFNREHVIRLANTPDGMASLIERVRPLFEPLLAVNTTTKGWLSLDNDPSKSRWQDDVYLSHVLHACKDRLTLLRDIPTLFSYFFVRPTWDDPAAREMFKKIDTSSLVPIARALHTLIQPLITPADNENGLSWTQKDDSAAHALQEIIVQAGKQAGLSYKTTMMAARYIISGTSVGPGVGKIMNVLGPRETSARINIFAHPKVQ